MPVPVPADVDITVAVSLPVPPISPTIIPNTHALHKKNSKLDTHRPGTKVLMPRNSSRNACWSHRPCVATQRKAARRPSAGCVRRVEVGR